MTTEKHDLDFYLGFYTCLLQDAASVCNVHEAEVWLDLQRLNARVGSEGMSFLTETLPSYGKALDRALSSGDALDVCAKKRSSTDLRPRFLWAYWSAIFDPDGELLPEPSVAHIRALRQVLYAVYKLALPYDESKNREVIDTFEAVERELWDIPERTFHDRITTTARRLIGRLLCNFDYRDIRPRHGPGAVSTGEKYHRKMVFRRLYTEIERVYPYTEYFASLSSGYPRLSELEELGAGTAKVVLVPKDSRGPRLISCEPLEYQWLQQGLGRKLQSFLERHPFTRGHVNFTDQTVNQDISARSSETREYATLDMKDASDRVSLNLVQVLFGDTALLEALEALRSYWTRLPDGRRVLLAKYAPMGSALCFPVEAVCFWALAVSVLINECGMKRRQALQEVYVYGDDIIVPRKVCAAVLHAFPKYGLMFNSAKCCIEGFFRESCGAESYRGFDVKPTRLRVVWCRSRDPRCLAAYTSYSNSLSAARFDRAANYIETKLTSLWGPIPFIGIRAGNRLKAYVKRSLEGNLEFAGSLPAIGFVRRYVNELTENRCSMKSRYNRRLQRTEFWCWGLKPVEKRCPQSPVDELFVALASGQPRSKPGVYAVRRRVAATRRWSNLD